MLVIALAPFLQLLNYAINPAMVGRWDLNTYLWSQSIIEVFLICLSLFFSKQIWVRIHVTVQSLDFFLFGKKINSLVWEDIISVVISKRIFDRVLSIRRVNDDSVYSFQINLKEMHVLYQYCNFLQVKDELKKIIDIWHEIK
jgi:hypothetical protein